MKNVSNLVFGKKGSKKGVIHPLKGFARKNDSPIPKSFLAFLSISCRFRVLALPELRQRSIRAHFFVSPAFWCSLTRASHPSRSRSNPLWVKDLRLTPTSPPKRFFPWLSRVPENLWFHPVSNCQTTSIVVLNQPLNGSRCRHIKRLRSIGAPTKVTNQILWLLANPFSSSPRGGLSREKFTLVKINLIPYDEITGSRQLMG